MPKISALFLLFATCAFAAGELSNRRAPGFALPDSSLKLHDLQDYRGKAVLIEFMQTTCAHCGELSEVLERVAAKYRDRVAVLSITNPPDHQGTVAQFISSHKVTVPILFDCGQVAAAYMKASPQRPSFHVPHVFLIDAQGMIRNDFGHELTAQNIFAELDRLLGSK